MLSRFVVSQVKHNSYFLVGLALGLWVSLVAVPLDEEPSPCALAATAGGDDVAEDFEPVREQRPSPSPEQPQQRVNSNGNARSVQRPRYYSTELGIRAPLLAGVLTSEDALSTRVAALNSTASRLQPALRFFITASTLQSAPPLANVVGFTDTREMLKPFHALKYLADNYLEEYDFFFLVSDTSYVNANKLIELVSQLSVSQDIYMGTVAEDDSHYCTLEGGILLSNSVLRAVHGSLDWCVRNSYSPRHHENIGRCVLHAAHSGCSAAAQMQRYDAVQLQHVDQALQPLSADAVTLHPIHRPEDFYAVHAYIARIQLQQASADLSRTKWSLRWSLRRGPGGYRNASWPLGLRGACGLAPRRPDNRFDHLRWTAFNATHALMPDDRRSVAPLTHAHKHAVDLVTSAACAWSVRLGAAAGVVEARLMHGAWQFDHSTAMRYRLMLRLAIDDGRGDTYTYRVQQVEVVRPLGAARLVPVPYVTESARVHVVAHVSFDDVTDRDDVTSARDDVTDAAVRALRRWGALAAQRNANVALTMVVVRNGTNVAEREVSSLRAEMDALRNGGANGARTATLVDASTCRAVPAVGAVRAVWAASARCAVDAALASPAARIPRDALILVADVYDDFNEDFLNRVRMNTIVGEQWFCAFPFRRFALNAHPKFVDAQGNKPQTNTGRFVSHDDSVLAFYRSDFDRALSSYPSSDAPSASISAVLSSSAHLRALCAPDPALVRAPAPPPCSVLSRSHPQPACLRATRADLFARVDLGAPHSLAKLVLEMQSDDGDTSQVK